MHTHTNLFPNNINKERHTTVHVSRSHLHIQYSKAVLKKQMNERKLKFLFQIFPFYISDFGYWTKNIKGHITRKVFPDYSVTILYPYFFFQVVGVVTFYLFQYSKFKSITKLK